MSNKSIVINTSCIKTRVLILRLPLIINQMFSFSLDRDRYR